MTRPSQDTDSPRGCRSLFQCWRHWPYGSGATISGAHQELHSQTRAAGDAIAGYKVGCIGAGVVEKFGISGPIHARLFRSEMRRSREALRHISYASLAIEGEMAFRIGADGQIAVMFPVIELHQFVFRAPGETLAELVANNGINAGAVIPPNLETTLPGDWADARKLSVAINGATIDSGSLWAMPGGAQEAVEWLRGDLGRFNGRKLLEGLLRTMFGLSEDTLAVRRPSKRTRSSERRAAASASRLPPDGLQAWI